MDEIKKLRGIYGMLCEISEMDPETIEDSMEISKKAEDSEKSEPLRFSHKKQVIL